jgi:thiamine biosynthesis lipoprotein
MFKPLFTILFPSLLSGSVVNAGVDRRVLAMGAELRLHLEGAGAAAGLERALAECARIEAECSTWNPRSSWSLVNAAEGQPVRLGQEWLALLSQMKAWNHGTEGAFDPVLMALMRAWGVREGGRNPDTEAVLAASSASGAQLLELDEEAGTARLLDPEAGLEEGGFIKGYALDRMRKASQAETGWMDFGGEVLAWGTPHGATLADPQHRDQPRLTLHLQNAALASSSPSERGRHILDPRNGQPCEAWGSAAVVTAEALTADVLSTALYVLGPEAGLAWAECHDVAAAFFLNEGDIRMTRAFRLLHPTLIHQEPA